MIVAKDEGGGGSYHNPEPGLHNAVCVKMFDLGMQEGYEGKMQHKVVIYFELEDRIPDGEYKGKRFMLSRTYTLSLNEKANLRKDLESWRGKAFTDEEAKGFDIEKLVNIPCTLNVIMHTANGKERARISGIMPKQKAAEPLIPELEKDWCPKWIEEAMGKSQEEMVRDVFVDDDPDGDIPF
jgi:hypothetical protein